MRCSRLIVLGGLMLTAAWGDPPPVRGLRVGADPQRVRLVFDLAVPVGYQVEAEGERLRVTLEGACDQGVPEVTDLGDVIVPRAELVSRQPSTVVQVRRRGLPPFRAFTLEDPPRLVVDIQKTYQGVEVEQVAEGVTWQRRVEGTAEGFRATNLLRIRWNQPGLQVRPELAGSTVLERDTVRRIAERARAVAAINGGFFAREGPPLGWLVTAGEWVKLPPWPRTALVWWSQERRYAMDQVFALINARFQRGDRLEVFTLNATPQPDDELALFTPRWGGQTPALPDFIGLSVEGGRITVATGWAEAAAIPPMGYALLINRRVVPRLHHDIRIGDQVELEFSTRPDWGPVEHALGAGPRLVREGKVFLTTEIERFQPDVATGRAPRAAVGFTQEQEMLWATVDGYGPPRGMTLQEWANWLRSQGAWDAMNLDGGASTSLVVGGQLRNFPSEGVERPVSNVLLLLIQPQE